MERLLQYLDDLDDLYGAFGLLAERLRNLAWQAGRFLLLLISVSASVLLALAEPPFALAIAIILFTTLLYRAVTEPGLEISH